MCVHVCVCVCVPCCQNTQRMRHTRSAHSSPSPSPSSSPSRVMTNRKCTPRRGSIIRLIINKPRNVQRERERERLCRSWRSRDGSPAERAHQIVPRFTSLLIEFSSLCFEYGKLHTGPPCKGRLACGGVELSSRKAEMG